MKPTCGLHIETMDEIYPGHYECRFCKAEAEEREAERQLDYVDRDWQAKL